MQCTRQCCCVTTLVTMVSVILVGVASFFILRSTGAFGIGPLHASCQIGWEFDRDCNDIKSGLINQMNAWRGNSTCGTISESCPAMPCGQNCLYEFINEEGNKIFGAHLTPAKRYRDSFNFEFNQEGAVCKVNGYSSSDLWYALLDYGTNYCNLRNLVDGAGFSNNQGFKETTSDSVCTQYSSRDCTRF